MQPSKTSNTWPMLTWQVTCSWGDGRVGEYADSRLYRALWQLLVWRMKGRKVSLHRNLDRTLGG